MNHRIRPSSFLLSDHQIRENNFVTCSRVDESNDVSLKGLSSKRYPFETKIMLNIGFHQPADSTCKSECIRQAEAVLPCQANETLRQLVEPLRRSTEADPSHQPPGSRQPEAPSLLHPEDKAQFKPPLESSILFLLTKEVSMR
jgi:hypothetical protein